MALPVAAAPALGKIGLPIIGAGLNFLGNIFGGSANRKARNLVDEQITDLTSYRDTQINRDPLKSNVGKNIMRRALDSAKERSKTIESNASITGASDESVIAQKEGVQKGLSDTMSNIASYATVREDQIEGRYRSNLSNLLGQKVNMLGNQAQSASNLASNAGEFVKSLPATSI